MHTALAPHAILQSSPAHATAKWRQYTQAIVRRPARSLAAGITTQQLGSPDMSLADNQHAAYIRALQSLGLAVTIMDAEESYPDGVFVEDVAILYQGTAIMTRPAAATRKGEVTSMRALLRERMPVVELTADPLATLDGGDVLDLGNRVLVGISRRTNERGVRALAAHLHALNPQVRVTGIPLTGVLHLKTGMTALHPDHLIRDPHCTITGRFSLAQNLSVLERAQGYGACVLPINDHLIIAAGFPQVRQLAEPYYGDRIIELDMSEFRKMDGSLTCLSLLW